MAVSLINHLTAVFAVRFQPVLLVKTWYQVNLNIKVLSWRPLAQAAGDDITANQRHSSVTVTCRHPAALLLFTSTSSTSQQRVYVRMETIGWPVNTHTTASKHKVYVNCCSRKSMHAWFVSCCLPLWGRTFGLNQLHAITSKGVIAWRLVATNMIPVLSEGIAVVVCCGFSFAYFLFVPPF